MTRLQLKRLRETVKRAGEVPFYAAAFETAGMGAADLRVDRVDLVGGSDAVTEVRRNQFARPFAVRGCDESLIPSVHPRAVQTRGGPRDGSRLPTPDGVGDRRSTRGLIDTVRYDNGRRVTNQTFPDAVEKKVEGGFITPHDSNGREIKTFSRDTFVVGTPGDSV